MESKSIPEKSVDIEKSVLNKMKTFTPHITTLAEFNPRLNYEISIPSLALSLLSVFRYRMKYTLIKARLLNLSAFVVNYGVFYYTLTNGYEFYKHYYESE